MTSTLYNPCSGRGRKPWPSHYSASSHSYDELSDHCNDHSAINSHSGYAKIIPRKKSGVLNKSESCDMWAIKPSDSVVTPKFLFQHPTYASQSQIMGKQSGGSAAYTMGNANSKNKHHKVGPRTLNPKMVNPYSKVPIRIHDLTKSESRVPHSSSLDAPRPLSEDILNYTDDPRQLCEDKFNYTDHPRPLCEDKFNYTDDHEPMPPHHHLINPRIYESIPSLGQLPPSTEVIYPATEVMYSATEVLDSDVLEDDMFLKDDYEDMTSDAAEDDESVDENYKALTDQALGLTSSFH